MMNRRKFLGFFGLAVAAPVVAKVVERGTYEVAEKLAGGSFPYEHTALDATDALTKAMLDIADKQAHPPVYMTATQVKINRDEFVRANGKAFADACNKATEDLLFKHLP
jgi:hypothetical protein